jgi:hypothetical protein
MRVSRIGYSRIGTIPKHFFQTNPQLREVSNTMGKFKQLHKLSLLPVTYKFQKNRFVTVYLMELDAHNLVFNFTFYEKKATRTRWYGEEHFDYKESFYRVVEVLVEYMDDDSAKELLQHLNWEE